MGKDELRDGGGFIPSPIDKWIIDPGKCNGCKECIDYCEVGNLEPFGKIVRLKDPTGCSQCTDCAKMCPFRAISFV